jgi:glutamine synthetase adenylyltransferase
MEFLQHIPIALRDSVERWWERARGQQGFLDLYRALPETHQQELPRVVAASEFVAQALIQDPRALAFMPLDEGAAALAAADYERNVAGMASPEHASAALREWRRRAMARIAWRDIAQTASVAETLRAVSELADGSIRAAASAAAKHLEAVFGRPHTANPAQSSFMVLGMGKLGGRELKEGKPAVRESSTTRSTSTVSAGRSFNCSTPAMPTASCFASTCVCGRSARAGLWL